MPLRKRKGCRKPKVEAGKDQGDEIKSPKINTAGKWKFVEVEGSEADPIPLQTMQKAVGGLIECWNLDVMGLPEIDVWFNEEGKIRALPLNPFASVLSGISFFGDVILGDVFICAHEGEGKSVGLNDEQEMSLRRLIDTTTRFIKEIQVLRKA